MKRVRNLKYLIEQLPYCAPPSSDSPPCAGHKLMSPGDVTGICSSFPHVLTARHRELWLAQQPDPAHFGSAAVLLTTGSLAVPEGGVLCTEGCGHSFWELAPKLTPLGNTVPAGGWWHPRVVRLDVYTVHYRLQSHSLLSPTLRAKAEMAEPWRIIP